LEGLSLYPTAIKRMTSPHNELQSIHAHTRIFEASIVRLIPS